MVIVIHSNSKSLAFNELQSCGVSGSGFSAGTPLVGVSTPQDDPFGLYPQRAIDSKDRRRFGSRSTLSQSQISLQAAADGLRRPVIQDETVLRSIPRYKAKAGRVRCARSLPSRFRSSSGDGRSK